MQRVLASQPCGVFIQSRAQGKMNEPTTKSLEREQNGGALIYVVDDEPLLLQLASVILEPHGYTVKTFGAAESALEAFKSEEPPPALIITDYMMHAMTGMELLEACRQIRPRQKTLLVSGTVGEEVFRNVAEKPNGYLVKPYQAKQLIDAVEAMLAD
jgi:CheY-like chemotaxis protein